MIGFEQPELLLLAVPVVIAWRTWRAPDRASSILRLLAGLLIVLALSGPTLPTSGSGRDVIVVIDRSSSMPRDADDSGLELVRLIEAQREPGDTVGVIAFGADVAIERSPQSAGRMGFFERDLNREGSDLRAALDRALALIPASRPGAIVLASDGFSSGADPRVEARRAAARDIPIHVRDLSRDALPDVAVERIELPERVEVGAPFQFTVWVRSDARLERSFELRRGAAVLDSGQLDLAPGLTRLVFRDVLERAGVADYELVLGTDSANAIQLGAALDRTPENDRGLGAVRALGPERVLVLTADGGPSTLSIALADAGLALDALAPESARLTPLGLTAYRAVVIENVDANRIGRLGMLALADFVTERGGGLLLTGGTASFGRGGYFRSALDPLLPVSMELRQEQRKFGVALSVALDRSGSMSAPVAGGGTKMDLANAGTVAAIETLSMLDSISIIAVDSAAHVVLPQTQLQDPAGAVSAARGIRSEGGGIFVLEALESAWAEVESATQLNRHIVLFADAADSESQAGCIEFVEARLEQGLSLSVIALGTETDSDAQFLKALALAGGGEAYFTTAPEELPRLFAQDVMTVSRSTFVDEPTATRTLPGLLGLGDLPTGGFPNLAGYNLTYARDEAELGVVTTDSYNAPVLAFCQRGLGRAAVYTGQVGGDHGADVVAWGGFQAAFASLVRWLSGLEEPSDVFARVRREGGDAVVEVELDPDSPVAPDLAALEASVLEPDGSRRALSLERLGPTRFEARLPLETAGVRLSTLKLGDGRFVDLPPVALSYSPEFERGLDTQRGARTLRELARLSGGGVLAGVDQALAGSRESKIRRSLALPLLLAGLLASVLEIAVRRLGLGRQLEHRAQKSKLSGDVLKSATSQRPQRSAPQQDSPRSDSTHGDSTYGDSTHSDAPAPEPAPSEPEAPRAGDLGSALGRAAERSRRRMR